MSTLRRILAVSALTLTFIGISAAGPLTWTSSATFGPDPTEFTWSVTVPTNFVPPAGDSLTGISLQLSGSAASSPFTLTNTAATSETFSLSAGEAITVLGTTAPDGKANGSFFVADSFNQGGIVLGPVGSGTCPVDTPSISCSSVSYDDANGSGSGSVFNIPTADWGQYLGGSVTYNGNTQATTTFIGGGGNITLNESTQASVTATLTYTYAPTGTPEPATLFLMGGALIGVGLVRKRIKS